MFLHIQKQVVSQVILFFKGTQMGMLSTVAVFRFWV